MFVFFKQEGCLESRIYVENLASQTIFEATTNTPPLGCGCEYNVLSFFFVNEDTDTCVIWFLLHSIVVSWLSTSHSRISYAILEVVYLWRMDANFIERRLHHQTYNSTPQAPTVETKMFPFSFQNWTVANEARQTVVFWSVEVWFMTWAGINRVFSELEMHACLFWQAFYS